MNTKITMSIVGVLILIPSSSYATHIFEDNISFAQFVDVALLGAEKYSIVIDEKEFIVYYGWGGSLEVDIEELKELEYPTVNSMQINTERISLEVSFTHVPDKTVMWLRVPFELISAEKENYQLFVDGMETKYDLTKFPNDYAIGLILPEGTQSLEIIGTNVVPEFGTITILILGITIFAAVFSFRGKSSFFNYN